MERGQIALQLYTVRTETARDLVGALRTVAEIGYRAVEFAGWGEIPVVKVRAALDEHGLQAISAHVPFTDFTNRPRQMLADLRTLGCAHAVVPSLPAEYREDAAAAREVAGALNRFGALCRDEGLRFGYHNHNFEFAARPNGDRTLFDTLVAETDPALVDFELDIFWAHVAGVDPVELLARLAGRTPVVHLKDLAAGQERADAPVGEGVLPWPQILDAAARAGAQWYVVEQDHPRDPFADARQSLRNLEGLAEPA